MQFNSDCPQVIFPDVSYKITSVCVSVRCFSVIRSEENLFPCVSRVFSLCIKLQNSSLVFYPSRASLQKLLLLWNQSIPQFKYTVSFSICGAVINYVAVWSDSKGLYNLTVSPLECFHPLSLNMSVWLIRCESEGVEMFVPVGVSHFCSLIFPSSSILLWS